MTRPATISWLGYGWETTYGTASASINKAFGHGVRVTNLNRKNNVEKIVDQGYRSARKLTPKGFEGNISTEWVLASPWFIRGILGNKTTTGTAPYVHTFTESDSVESFTISNNVGLESDYLYNLLGAKFSSVTITSAVNELVRVRADIPYANEVASATTTSKLTDSFDLFTFAQASIELPGGTTLAMVQNVEATFNNNLELVKGQGSRFAQEAVVKNADYDVSVTMAFQKHSDLLQLAYGAAAGPQSTITEQADMKLIFTNGLTGSNMRKIEFTYTGVMIDEDSLPQDPTQLILEDVTLMTREVSVAVSNNVATPA